MNPDKEIIIDGLLERLNQSPYVIVVSYARMTVRQFDEIRKRLREVGSTFHVAKNSFVKQACAKAGLPDGLAEHLKGQSAIVSGNSDVCAAAKIVKNFAAEFQKPEIRAGAMDGNLLSQAQIMALANLPTRDVLLATLLGVFQAPASQLVRTLNEPGASLARVLQAKADQG
ncbi:MAG: 50S ribosomal protein L10 [Verrucomicrobia bacterium]|nr:50S ribosomal protein L10 [Verrucomicrobiota bacterium]